jgi:signal recognition particle subunit SEC65
MKQSNKEKTDEILEELKIDECVYPFTKFRVKEACKIAIQLTQSKIIQIIDKRIEELNDFRKYCHIYESWICDFNLEELESLKKEVK